MEEQSMASRNEKTPSRAAFEPLKPLVRLALSEQVATTIADMITGGKLKPGEKLPSEAELGGILRVSRSTVREALKSLAFVGLVNMRTGEGTYVSAGPSKVLNHVLAQGVLNTEREVRDLTDARMALESELASLCAQRATDEDFRVLEGILRRMAETTESGGDEFLRLDLEFHLGIATCSQSRVLAQLLQTIRGLLQELIAKSAQFPGDRDITLSQHLKILEALKARDRRKARSAVREHLRTFHRGYRLVQKGAKSQPESGEQASP